MIMISASVMGSMLRDGHNHHNDVGKRLFCCQPPVSMIGLLRRMSLSQWIILAMIAGILFGWQFPDAASHSGIVSDLFIRLIKCIIVPLIFSTLVVGIAGHTDDLKAVGRLALKSIVYFEVITTLALLIGLAAVNLVQPGAGIQMSTAVGRPS